MGIVGPVAALDDIVHVDHARAHTQCLLQGIGQTVQRDGHRQDGNRPDRGLVIIVLVVCLLYTSDAADE